MDNKLGLEQYDMEKYWSKRAKTGNNVYERVCVYGTSSYFNMIMDNIQRKCLLRLSDNLESLKGKNVLEVGCGVGRWSKLMKQAGANYVGVDISEEMVAIAKDNVSDAVFKVIDGQNLTCFPSNYFDLVFTVTVLHHIPYEKKEKLIAEIVRVTKAGGNILIIEDINHKKGKDASYNMFSYSLNGWLDVFRILGCTPLKIYKHKFLYGKLQFIIKEFPFLNNVFFAKFWSYIIEEIALKVMPLKFFAGVGILFQKKETKI